MSLVLYIDTYIHISVCAYPVGFRFRVTSFVVDLGVSFQKRKFNILFIINKFVILVAKTQQVGLFLIFVLSEKCWKFNLSVKK